MRVRALDANGDMQFGRGQANFLQNKPAAVAQCVQTRLGEYVGDWFLDLAAGTPWRTQVLGKFTNATRDPFLRARILGTQGVVSIVTYASQIGRSDRSYSVQAKIETSYGQALVATATPFPAGDVRLSR